MESYQENLYEIPLYISRSLTTTLNNKTGSWRFMRPGYDEKTAPCSTACPAGEDIARIEMLAARGLFQEAWELILQENPLPAVCGRVCFHPCEGACNRGEWDEPVAIHHLERFIGDMAIQEGFRLSHVSFKTEAEAGQDRRIAIAGSGPAGLSAAYFLRRLGYDCEVFEADAEPGGLLRWGIPRYRLPKEVLNSEIDRIQDMGVRIRCSHPVTADFLSQARGRYDAVFMGCGYGRSMNLGIPGQEAAEDGLKFLHHIQEGKSFQFKGRTAVIGGGNTAIDVARSLARMGAQPMIIYRRRRLDMPAFKHEIDMALEEGIRLMELFAPIHIEKEGDGCILTLQRMKISGMETGTSRARVMPDGEKTQTIRLSHVFSAIGAEPEANWLLPPRGEGEDVIALGHCVLWLKDIPRVFGGDLTTPIKSVTDAIASGKHAAMALDAFFRQGREGLAELLNACRVGNGPARSMEIYLSGQRKQRSQRTVSFKDINPDYFPRSQRLNPAVFPPMERARSFDPVELSLDKDMAVRESGRCFNCGLCNDCDNCRLYCPELAVFIDQFRRINLDYCKGCGICVIECPRGAMSLEEEKA